jgi:hypothetical protein
VCLSPFNVHSSHCVLRVRVNTAILPKIITPFTRTVTGARTDLLPTINALLWSELWLAPFLRIFDMMGNLKKHFWGPRFSRTQEGMNLSFQGTIYYLGERYTVSFVLLGSILECTLFHFLSQCHRLSQDLTKVLFLCFFYSALFPATFFFCGGILIVQYYADKFCLMVSLRCGPELNICLAVLLTFFAEDLGNCTFHWNTVSRFQSSILLLDRFAGDGNLVRICVCAVSLRQSLRSS